MIVIILTVSIAIIIAIGVCIKKIHAYKKLKKMIGEQIKESIRNIRPEDTFTFDELEAEYNET